MSREECTDRDGVFSYPAEWHAFTHGVYLGFTTRPLKTPPQPDDDDVRKELHYYRGGYLIGSSIQIVLMLLVFTFTLNIWGL